MIGATMSTIGDRLRSDMTAGAAVRTVTMSMGENDHSAPPSEGMNIPVVTGGNSFQFLSLDCEFQLDNY
jgi:hypothetical protein